MDKDENIGVFFPNIADIEALPPLQPGFTERSWGMASRYSQVVLPSRRSQQPSVPISKQPEPKHVIPSRLQLPCPQINVPGRMRWGQGVALCQRPTKSYRPLHVPGKLDKPCLLPPPCLLPNCPSEGQRPQRNWAPAKWLRGDGTGAMPWDRAEPAERPCWPWMGAWQLSRPGSQGRLMAGQAPPLCPRHWNTGWEGEGEQGEAAERRWSSGRCDTEETGWGCAYSEHIQKQQLLRARQHSRLCKSSPGTLYQLLPKQAVRWQAARQIWVPCWPQLCHPVASEGSKLLALTVAKGQHWHGWLWSYISEPGGIHLQMCRCDLLGKNIMGHSMWLLQHWEIA